MLPPINTFLYVQWTEDGDELPGWYKSQVLEYFSDGSCKIIYCGDDDCDVTEIVDLNSIEWKPCSKRVESLCL